MSRGEPQRDDNPYQPPKEQDGKSEDRPVEAVVVPDHEIPMHTLEIPNVEYSPLILYDPLYIAVNRIQGNVQKNHYVWVASAKGNACRTVVREITAGMAKLERS